VILKAFNYLVDNLDGLSPSALALSDFFRIATTFSNEILDVQHVVRKVVSIFRRESESSLSLWADSLSCAVVSFAAAWPRIEPLLTNS
jgi:hypothetical protein